jgi:hypothetical protein
MSVERRGDEEFLLGATYWPRSKGLTWWRRHDRGEVREELAQAAALGLNAVRLHLLWEAFQPRLDRVAAAPMQALEQTLDAAQESGLQVIATLFAGAVGGALCCPPWLTSASAEVDLARLIGGPRRGGGSGRTELAVNPERRRVVFEDGYHDIEVRELYDDAPLLAAQQYLVREVVGYFGSHPALYAWELAHQAELLRMPRAAEPFAEWQRRLTQTAREHGARRVLAAVGLRALARPQGPRPDSLAETGDGLLAVADPPRGLERPARPLLEESLLALELTQALAPLASIFVDDVGLPTAFDDRAGWVADEAYGHEQPCFLASEEQQADALSLRLPELYEGGAAGVILASLADASRELWALPPLKRGLRARTVGLLHANGTEKAAAGVLARFASQLREAPQRRPARANLNLGVDLERYARQPGAELQRLMRLASG